MCCWLLTVVSYLSLAVDNCLWCWNSKPARTSAGIWHSVICCYSLQKSCANRVSHGNIIFHNTTGSALFLLWIWTFDTIVTIVIWAEEWQTLWLYNQTRIVIQHNSIPRAHAKKSVSKLLAVYESYFSAEDSANLLCYPHGAPHAKSPWWDLFMDLTGQLSSPRGTKHNQQIAAGGTCDQGDINPLILGSKAWSAQWRDWWSNLKVGPQVSVGCDNLTKWALTYHKLVKPWGNHQLWYI